MALDFTTENRRALRRTVRAKRRAYWDKAIALAEPGKPIFRIMEWRKRKDPFQPPPLKDGEDTYSTPKEIATHLGDKLLNRQSAEGDIGDPWAPIPPPTPVPLTLEMTEEQAREAVRIGYHPNAFRNAEVVMIPKPGKAPHNIAKKWRPISLLSCVGRDWNDLLQDG